LAHYLNHWYQKYIASGFVFCQGLEIIDATKLVEFMGTISKALNLLNFFSEARPEIGLTEFKKLSKQDKATVHRHLTELEQIGFLEQDSQTRGYRLGPAILRLSGVREATFPARRAVRPVVDRLSEELGELVHVGLLQGSFVSPLYHKDAMLHGTRVFFDAAQTPPLHATATGLITLAFGPEGLLERVLKSPLERMTEMTITDPEQLLGAVRHTRDRGYSFSDQSLEIEVCSFGMPIFDRHGIANAAIAVALPRSRVTPDKTSQILAALGQASRELTTTLGGRLPDSATCPARLPSNDRMIQ
jgi:DNA-binding IclR family transcriptional regulator